MTNAVAVDFFSVATCQVNEAGSSLTLKGVFLVVFHD